MVRAVNTAKQKCPTMSIGSQQSPCDVITELAPTAFVPAGAGSARWRVVLIGATITGLDPGPIAMAIGIVGVVHTTNR